MIELTLPSRIESVEQAAMLADEFARNNGCGDDVLSAVDLAVRESVANAVKHGNKFDDTKEVNGRGILFMRSFMDEVEWSNPPGGGMQVKMVKKR